MAIFIATEEHPYALQVCVYSIKSKSRKKATDVCGCISSYTNTPTQMKMHLQQHTLYIHNFNMDMTQPSPMKLSYREQHLAFSIMQGLCICGHVSLQYVSRGTNAASSTILIRLDCLEQHDLLQCFLVFFVFFLI